MSSTSSRFNSCCSLASTLHYEYELKLSRNNLVKRLDRTCLRYLKKHPVSRLYDYSRYYRIRPNFVFTEIPQVCGIEYCCHAYLQGFCGVGKSFNKKTSKQFASEELLYKIMFGDGTNEHPPERYVSQRLHVAVVPDSSMESLEPTPRPFRRLPQLRGRPQQRRYRRPYHARARSHNGDTRPHNGDLQSLDGSSQSLYGGSRRSLPELFTLEYERNAQSDPEMDQTAACSLGALNGSLGESSSQSELRSSLPEISSTSFVLDNHVHQRLSKESEDKEADEPEEMSQDETEDENSANEENVSAEESAEEEEENEVKVERPTQKIRTPIRTPTVLSDIEEFCEDEEENRHMPDNGTAEKSNEKSFTDEKFQGYLEKFLEKKGDKRKPIYVTCMKNGKYEVQCSIYMNNNKETTCGKGDTVNAAKELCAVRMLDLLRERECAKRESAHSERERAYAEQERAHAERERAERLQALRERVERERMERRRAARERSERERTERRTL